MLLVAQSLALHAPPLGAALAAGDDAPLVAAARSQLAAGAGALDLNAGVDGTALPLFEAARALRRALVRAPLFLDAASPSAIAMALELCEREGVARPLVANALAVGGAAPLTSAEEALLRAVARGRAGLVVSPRLADADDTRPATPEALRTAAAEAAEGARLAGVSGALYLDALAYPPAHDAPRARRSLALLRAYAALRHVEPLVAVGNVGHGARAPVRPALRRLYAAAAVGAGATALLLPVEEPSLRDAVALAAGTRAPAGETEAWLASVAAWARAGLEAAPSPPPAGAGGPMREAWQLQFG